MFAHNIYYCLEEVESPRKQLHADGIRTHAKVYNWHTLYDPDQQALIKELHLVRPVGRTSRSDITWLVRFSIDRLYT